MITPRRSLSSICVLVSCLAAVAVAACAESEPNGATGTAGTSATGAGGSTAGGGGTASAGTAGPGQAGTVGTAGTTGSGVAGTIGSAGTIGAGGRGGTTGVAGTNGGAGTTASAGTNGSGGAIGSAGTNGSAGTIGGGGRGGTTGSAGTLGAAGRGGVTGSAGRGGTTGTAGTSGGGTTGAGGSPLNCSGTLPSGGTQHASSNASGTAAGMSWTIWSNGSGGSITTYDTPAFKATWNNSGDFLARLGLQWNASKTFDQYGTITAQIASKKTGTGGGYSYIGIYGWSVSPCVEFYIVDDSYNGLPVNPGNTTNKGMVDIDGGTYIMYTRDTTGTGGSKCPNVSNWVQFYSIRKTARQCGQISVTQHFKAWAAAGMTLGKMDQAQILVEVGGGSGSVEFSTASMTAQ